MRRQQIIKGLREIEVALDKSGLLGLINDPESRTLKAGENPDAMITALHTLSLRAASFSQEAQELMKIFDFGELLLPKTWARALREENQARSLLFAVSRRVHYFMDYTPQITKMLRQDSIESLAQSNPDIERRQDEFATQTLVVASGEAQVSSTERVTAALTGYRKLYETLSQLEDAPPHQLGMIACDSGSDMSFDLLGLSKVVEATSDLILDVWDRIVFYRERQLAERLDLIAKGLPVLETIKQMEADGNISKEKSELLRRGVTEGIQEFVNAGAILPEMEGHSHYDPAMLMKPAPKLLSAPDEIVGLDKNEGENGDPEAPGGPDLEELTPEERAKLKRLLDREAKSDEEDDEA